MNTYFLPLNQGCERGKREYGDRGKTRTTKPALPFTKHPVDLKHRRTQNIHRGLFVVVLAEDLEAQISLCQWTHCGVQLTKGPLPCGDSLISQRVTLFTGNTPPRQAVLSCIFATCTFSHRNHKEGLKPHKYAIF